MLKRFQTDTPITLESIARFQLSQYEYLDNQSSFQMKCNFNVIKMWREVFFYNFTRINQNLLT